MGKKLTLALIVLGMVFLGCESIEQDRDCVAPYITHGLDCCLDENANRVCDSDEASGYDENVPTEKAPPNDFPTITTKVSPTNPSFGDSFSLTVESKDDIGLNYLSFKSTKSFSEHAKAEEYACNSEKSCSYTWELTPEEEGVIELKMNAVDSLGLDSGYSRATVTVGPARAAKAPKPVGPECGDGKCEASESKFTCIKDCPFFTCGNHICEGGESYESCPPDCSLQDILGTSPADGACEPGEDINNAPHDCTDINPQCGNNICDKGEDRYNCYADCPGIDESSKSSVSCNSHSDCGYKQRCIGSVCQSVECTSDSHCSGCRKCSGNRCVSCGSGPYGCYC